VIAFWWVVGATPRGDEEDDRDLGGRAIQRRAGGGQGPGRRKVP